MKNLTKTQILCLFFLFGQWTITTLAAQKFRYSIPGLDSLETFIVGGGSSSTLPSGKAEAIFSNTLVSNWIAIHEKDQNSPITDRFRQTQFNSEVYGFYGISQSGKWDLGVHLKYTRTRLDNAARSSMFRVFRSDNNTELAGADQNTTVFDESLSGLAYVGLRFRIRPFSKVPALVINGGYDVSTVKNPIEQRQLSADRDMADIGITYYKEITPRIFYFFGASANALLPSTVRDEYLYGANLNFFLIHRSANRKLTFYPGLGYGLAFKPSQFDRNALIKTVDYLFAYGGLQYALAAKISLFATGGFPVSIDLKNPQQEIVRKSYSILALGGRFEW